MSKWHYDLTLSDGSARIGEVEADNFVNAMFYAKRKERVHVEDVTRAVVREEGEALEELKREMGKEMTKIQGCQTGRISGGKPLYRGQIIQFDKKFPKS